MNGKINKMELHKMILTSDFCSNSYQNTKTRNLAMYIKDSKHFQFLQNQGNLCFRYSSKGYTIKKYYILLY